MNFKLIRSFWLCISIVSFTNISAQKLLKDEYKAEIGVNTGLTSYIGETNKTLFSNVRIAYSGYLRYRFDNRFAAKAELVRATVAGSGIVDNPIFAGDICGEFNFFDLEQNPYKRFSKTLSPYVFLGLSMVTEVYNTQKFPEFGFPFGIGLKVKLNKRWNLNAQWTNRLIFADNLEGYTAPNVISNYNNPSGLNGSNILNNDLVMTYTVGLSFDIWKKQCDCKNNFRK